MQATIVHGLSPLSLPGQNVSMHVELDDEERQQSLAMRQSLGYVCEDLAAIAWMCGEREP